MADEAEQTGGAQTGSWVDPYRAYNFKLQVHGITQGHFTECAGLGVKVHTIEYREAGAGQVVHRLPGQVQYGDVTLRYGLTSSTELWDWFMTSVQGEVERKNVSIVMLGSDGATPVLQWDLVNAWICEWRGAPLDALGREAAIETMTMVFETLERS